VKEIEEESREIGLQISRVMLSGGNDVKSRIRDMKQRVDSLNEEKAYLMTENNFKIDYMDMMYHCPLCRDTGTQDTGDRCICFAERLAAIQKMD
jgi:DNA replication protein DnaC